MSLASLSLLDKHCPQGFAPGYPDNERRFFSPVDDVHGALVDVIKSATMMISPPR
jgi:hypothetical protein